MRGRATRSAIAASSALLAVLGIAGCNQSTPSGEKSSQSDLKIVEQVQIDQNGAEVKADSGHHCRPTPPATARPPARRCPSPWPVRSTARTPPSASTSRTACSWPSTSTTPPTRAARSQLKPFDTEGDPQKATAIAPQIVDDAFTIGLVGPAFSGETKATGAVFDQAGLVAATASATNVTLSEQGWKTFFRGLANDGVQGPSVANYLKNTARPQEGLRRRRQHRLRHRPGHRRFATPSARSPIPRATSR